MPPTTSRSPEELRAQFRTSIIKLSLSCHCEHDNPDACPLCPMRKMDLNRRLLWVRELTVYQMANIVSLHATCPEARHPARASVRIAS